MRAPDPIAKNVWRLTAPNPGPMTHTGTQTYLIGHEAVAVIDPGPDDPGHVAAVLDAAQGPISHILVTHAHVDHTGAVPALAKATGAPVLAFGPATAGRSEGMARLAARGGVTGGEGVDAGFAPDQILADGARVAGPDWQVTALHTPGHLSSHMSFVLDDTDIVFTGDTVMGWSTTLISPPDGSVGDFMASVERLAALGRARYLPGHGDIVPDGPTEALRQAAHRRAREAQVVQALEHGPGTPGDLTTQIYHDVPQHLHPAAQRNVLAHLIDLAEQGRVAMPDGTLEQGRFRLL